MGCNVQGEHEPGLQGHDCHVEEVDENMDILECRNFCYSKKHINKAWEGKKCNWFACSTCPECTTTTTTTTPPPTPAPTPLPTNNPTPSPTPSPTPNPTPSPTPSPTPAPTPTTTTTSSSVVSLEGLDDEELEQDIDDEQAAVTECANWCYSKKHKDKSWDQKCGWNACQDCPECNGRL